MYLSDTELRSSMKEGRLQVFPPPEEHRIQPCSIDIRLGPTLLRYSHNSPLSDVVDLREQLDIEERYTQHGTEGYILASGEFVLGSTFESVALAPTLCAHVDGRSTLGRLGLMVHATAGFIDPGFKGHVTLELYNLSMHAIVLSAGIGIGQLLVSRVDGVVQNPYGTAAVGSKYGGFQSGPVPPKLGRKL